MPKRIVRKKKAQVDDRKVHAIYEIFRGVMWEAINDTFPEIISDHKKFTVEEIKRLIIEC